MRDEIREVMGFLREKDDPALYEKYCLEPVAGEVEALEKSLKRTGVLGSDLFVEEVKSRIQAYSETQKEAPTAGPLRPGPVFIFIVGALVLTAAASSVYLYVSKAKVEAQYESLLERHEAEFAEKIKFENRSPLTPTELENTQWEIELVPQPGSASQAPLRDKIRFTDGRFSSEAFEAKGFRAAIYFLVPEGQGKIRWQSAQSDPQGDTLSWRGEWQGEAMKGTLSRRQKNGEKQDFSFYSAAWAYSGRNPVFPKER